MRFVLAPLLLSLLCCTSSALCGSSNGNDVITLENSKIRLVFDGKTGALEQMINRQTGDNYIKQPTGGNPFRLYVDTDKMPALTAGEHNDPYGGSIADARTCRLVGHTLRKMGRAAELQLQIRLPAQTLELEITVTLPDAADYFDCALAVTNHSGRTRRIYTSLPYFSGIGLGKTPATNLAINMWDRGYPGINAWGKNSGGVYGKEVSMQWQCVYEPALDEGLAFIAMDSTFSNKILTCFPGGGMQSLYFDEKTLQEGSRALWPAARIVVFKGNWRTAARRYRDWAQQAIKPRPVPQWYVKDVAIRSSSWFPPRDVVEKNKATHEQNNFTSFRQLMHFYKDGYADGIEMAMWNEDVYLWPETYGPYMSSGFLDFRPDLGGKAAYEAGVKELHRLGRKAVMYVAGYGIRTSSPLFKNDDWKKWAIVDNEKNEINFSYRNDNEIYGIFTCPGYKPRQDEVIRICKMLASAGVDEIRLDEIGFPFKPCFNPEHHHKSPYDSHIWMREYLRRIREAVDSINPNLSISTEFFMDYFHTYTNGALVMDCSGSELDAMKVALPGYLALSYHGGSAEAALTGAVMCRPEAYRQDWAWADIGTERPAGYPAGPGPVLPYYDIYPSFAEIFIQADPADKDPVVVNDSVWSGHLWKSKQYWLLTGGHADLTALPEKDIEVQLPELPRQFAYAFEYNVVTGEMQPVKIFRKGPKISVHMHHPLSLIFFPAPSCPPLALVKSMPPSINAGASMEMTVKLYAPWNPQTEKKNMSEIALTVPGFEAIKGNVEGNTAHYTIGAPADIESGNYFIQVQGNCLPLKKWFRAVQMK